MKKINSNPPPFKVVRCDSREWLSNSKEGRPSELKQLPAYAEMLTQLHAKPLKDFEVCGFELPIDALERSTGKSVRNLQSNLRRSLKNEVLRLQQEDALGDRAKYYQVRVFQRDQTLCAGIANLPPSPNDVGDSNLELVEDATGPTQQ